MIGLQHAWRSNVAGRLLLLFLLVTLVPAGALVVLGLRLASQDRELLGQRIAELRQADLDGAVRALSAEVQSWQGKLATRDFRGAASLPSDSALILVSTREARALPPGRMLWSPLPPRLAQAPDTDFREAGQLEFAAGREEEALRAYESLAQSPDAAVRAGEVLAKGWGYATVSPGSIQADSGAGLTSGIIGLVNKGQYRKADDWGALRAWAWGASRALDYFEKDKSVDAKHVALEGHSRYGKATIVAMAYDARFWTAYVSSSGAGGAKLHRRNWGEIVENVAAASEYNWMAGNFLKYAGPLNWNDLPVDSHELVAMCAPRPVFLSAGKGGYDAEPGGDSWVDAKGTFLAGVGAGPVYRLLGKKDLGTSGFPPIETPLMDGDVAFRQHAGGHTDGPNWPVFLTFASRHVKAR